MTLPETRKPTWRLLPEGALPAGVVVCERTGRWAAGLRRELKAAATRWANCPGDAARDSIPAASRGTVPFSPRRKLGQSPGDSPGVRETRTFADAAQAMALSPASVAVIELTLPRLERLLAWLSRLERDFPLALAAVVADRNLAEYEWLVREAGAIYFTTALRGLFPLAEIALRHVARSPQAPVNAAEQIWASLPWGKAEG